MWQELFAMVYRYLRGRGLSHADAEDLAQDTLLVAYQHLDGIEPGSLYAWIRAVARNKHIDLIRRRGKVVLVARTPDSSDPADDPLTAALLSDGQGDVRRVLALLPPTDRRLLELKYLEDHSVEEVAAALGRSVNTVKVGLFRARKRLRAQIEKGRS